VFFERKKFQIWGFLFLKESEFVPKYLGQNHGFSGVKLTIFPNFCKNKFQISTSQNWGK
jgi:hypothetical protein